MGKIELTEPRDSPDDSELWDDQKINWNKDGYIDSFKAEETLEEGDAERKMRARIMDKGKVTARDLEFERKFKLKKRQLEIRKLQSYANSLTGSNKLHPPIILTEDKSK